MEKDVESMITLTHSALPSPILAPGRHNPHISLHPAYCHVCTNFNPETADSLFVIRDDVRVHETLPLKDYPPSKDVGVANVDWNGEIQPDMTDDDAHMAWFGKYRLDRAPWQVTARLVDVKKAAESGCPSCQILKQGIEGVGRAKISSEDKQWQVVLNYCQGSVLRAYIRLYKEDDEDDEELRTGFEQESTQEELAETTTAARMESVQVEFYTLLGQPSPWPTLGSSMTLNNPQEDSENSLGGHTRHVPLDSSSDACFLLIDDWIRDCKNTHPLCKERIMSAGRPSMPTRLIDVGPYDSRHICLRDGSFVSDAASNFGKSVPYVALSHCWGKTRHLVTERHTIQRWKQEIPWKLLPKTFQDAIAITRRLRVRYVWIDSLCIIQDDDEDWIAEAANMTSIYSHAFVVVSATASSDGDGGCFTQRSPTIPILGCDRNGRRFKIFARRASSHTALNWGDDFWKNAALRGTLSQALERYPLFRRAWCFQERLLSPRLLHYTTDEIVFECISMLNCECGALNRFIDDPLLSARQSIMQGSKTKDTVANDALDLWRNLVAQYSRRKLTFPTDVLVALSGLALKFHKTWEKELGPYIAGLWGNDILNGLLWKAVEWDDRRILGYLGPTWSWCSIQRGIDWVAPGSERLFYARATDPLCEYKAGKESFGKCEDASIKLTGPLVEVTLSTIRIDEDEAPGGFLRSNFRRNVAYHFWVDRVDDGLDLVGKTVFCMRICRDVTNRQTGQGFDTALVLKRCHDRVKGRSDSKEYPVEGPFERIGIMEHYPITELEKVEVLTEVEIV